MVEADDKPVSLLDLCPDMYDLLIQAPFLIKGLKKFKNFPHLKHDLLECVAYSFLLGRSTKEGA